MPQESTANNTPALPAAQIEEQLSRMLASSEFQRAARSAKFLEFVVRHALLGNGKPIAESDVAKAVFKRTGFDARLDPIVRVEGARLRKKIQTYYANDGKSDPVSIQLPQRGYLPEFEPRVAEGSAMVPEGPPDGMRLAVLPFADLTDDKHLAGFCSGLTEEVIACITDMSNISVVSRTSASVYEGEAVDLRAVGKELGVSHILEGSVRQGESQVRVTAKLIDCASGFTVWSKSHEAETSVDALDAQEMLAGLIAETLAENGGQPAPASDPKANADC